MIKILVPRAALETPAVMQAFLTLMKTLSPSPLAEVTAPLNEGARSLPPAPPEGKGRARRQPKARQGAPSLPTPPPPAPPATGEEPAAAATPSPREDSKRPRARGAAKSAAKSPAEGAAKNSAKGAAKSSAKGAAKSPAKGAAKSPAKGAAKSTAEGAAKSTAKSAAKSTAEGAAKSTAEGAAKSTAEGAAKSTAEGAAKTSPKGSTKRAVKGEGSSKGGARAPLEGKPAQAEAPRRLLTASELARWCQDVPEQVSRFVRALGERKTLTVSDAVAAAGMEPDDATRFFGLLGSAARWVRFEGSAVQTPWRRDGDAYSWVKPKRG